jgi:1-acyl-sn-glycerol-3-phosphate acyltransferase
MPDDREITPFAVRIFRLLRLSVHLAGGLFTVTSIFPFLNAEEKARRVRRWSCGLLDLLNIGLDVEGRPPMVRGRGAMLVANHVSWLDIFTLNAVCAAHFVSKSEVKHWPVLGWLARRVGTLFIERERRADIARINGQVAALLRAGACVAFFPEGTTTDGSRVLPFRPSLLQPVVDARAELWPVAVRYVREDGSLDTRPAYIDNMSFPASLATILRSRRLRVRLHFLPPITAPDADRRALALTASESISASLGVSRSDRRHETPVDLPGTG